MRQPVCGVCTVVRFTFLATGHARRKRGACLRLVAQGSLFVAFACACPRFAWPEIGRRCMHIHVSGSANRMAGDDDRRIIEANGNVFSLPSTSGGLSFVQVRKTQHMRDRGTKGGGGKAKQSTCFPTNTQQHARKH
jgi:hypothetical protein